MVAENADTGGEVHAVVSSIAKVDDTQLQLQYQDGDLIVNPPPGYGEAQEPVLSPFVAIMLIYGFLVST